MKSFKRLVVASAFIAISCPISQSVAQQCKPVNPKRVVLFINANGAYNEARAAERAACQAGEKFMMIPEIPWAALKSYEDAAGPIQAAETEAGRIYVLLSHTPAGDPRKKELEAQYNATLKKETALLTKRDALLADKNADDDAAKAKIQEIAKSGATIASLVVSGHDGGGNIHGATADINGSQLRSAISDAYAGNKNFKGCPMESVFLWGCYTAVPDQVIEWKTSVPCLKVVGGYWGSAPAAVRPASATLLSQMMTSKDRLSSASSKSQFTAALASITAFNQTNAALLACDSRQSDPGKGWYAANRAEDGAPLRGRLAEVMNCDDESTTSAVETVTDSIEEYESGNKEIPEDTARGPIRVLYNSARFLQSCITKADADDAGFSDRTGLLLFFHGVKQVFARTFEKQISEAKAEIEAMIAASPKDSEAQRKLQKLIPVPDREAIKTLGRIPLLKYMSQLQAALSDSSVGRVAGAAKNPMEKIQRLSRLMEVYLNARDIRCMSPWLAWHDPADKATPVIPKTPLCQGDEDI